MRIYHEILSGYEIAMKSSLPLIYQQRDHIVVPGFTTAHSHAFQRALRKRTQRKRVAAGSFWSWRSLMYQLAEKLDPEDLFNIARFAFTELTMSGVTAVGEFHYIHHTPEGTPYDDRVVLTNAVIRAAKEVGLRITLIRTAYFRAGHSKTLESAQKRFCDSSVEQVVQDVETLINRYAADPMVHIALAAHSIRAVPRQQIIELARYAQKRSLPFHMHVAEQRREIEECEEEFGMRPVEMLAGDGVLSPNFVGIHATHLNFYEIKSLGEARASVCICRTTERDLGDGYPETASLVQAGVKICVGVDSHASSDAFEEVRAVELDERTRIQARNAVSEAPELLIMATQNGLHAIGMDDAWNKDKVYLNAFDPTVALIKDDILTEAVIFSATPRAVDEVVINGHTVVKDGMHIKYDEAFRGYEKALRKLGLI